MQNIVPVVDAALKKAGIGLSHLNAIAFTQSPALIGSLLVGSQFAKSLAQALNIPLVSVHHMQAHVLANLIGPAACVLISILLQFFIRSEVVPNSLPVIMLEQQDAPPP